MISKDLVLKDSLAKRNLELTREEVSRGSYGEIYLEQDAELFKKYREGQKDLLSIEHRIAQRIDEPTWQLMMNHVKLEDKVLCLAGGGGQQSVIYSLLGAKVTVLDLTPEQLRRDEIAARHYGYEIETIQGDMRDLSAFESDYFDWVHQPISLLYVPDLIEVYRGVHRVLKQRGRYFTDYTYPGFYVVEDKGWDGEGYVMRFSQPHISGPLLERESDGYMNFEEGISFGESNHLLSDIINGQISEGMTIKGLWESPRPRQNPSLEGPVPGSPEQKECYIPWGISTISEKC